METTPEQTADQQTADQPRMSSSDTISRGEIIALALERCWVGIIYSTFVYLMIGPIALGVYWLFTLPIPENVLLPFFGVCCAVIGAMIIAMAASSIALGLVVGINWSFGDFFSARTAAVAFGSLSGFLATVWIGFNWFPNVPTQGVMLSCLYVAGGMIVGYVGAIWIGLRREVWGGVRVDDGGFQFQIKHVLVLMIWLSAMLTLDRFIGGHRIAALTGVYVVVQVAILMFDGVWFAGRKQRGESVAL